MTKGIALLTVLSIVGLGGHAGAQGTFKPARKLSGTRIKPKGAFASIIVPKGWKHRWGEGQNGESAYLVLPPGGEKNGIIAISILPLSLDEQQVPMDQLIMQGAQELLGGAPAQVVVPAKTFRIGQHRAGQLILQVQAPKKDGTVATLEGNLAGIVVQQFGYVFLGLYESKNAKRLRAGMNTILAGFKAAPPKENLALKRKLAGCWTKYSGNTDSAGSGSSEQFYQFGHDGSYSYKSNSFVSVAGATASSSKNEVGLYKVIGSTIHYFPKGEKPSSGGIRFKGGILYLGDAKLIPCS